MENILILIFINLFFRSSKSFFGEKRAQTRAYTGLHAFLRKYVRHRFLYVRQNFVNGMKLCFTFAAVKCEYVCFLSVSFVRSIMEIIFLKVIKERN